MRAIWSVLAASAVLSVLSGCGGGDGPAEDGQTASREIQPSATAAEMEQQIERNKLRILGLALLNHHDAMAMLPNPGTAPDPDGRIREVSWRVRVLGFLEELSLWHQFHPDEPWDSDINKPLIEQVPDVYAAFSGEDAGTTRVHVFVSSETPFGGDQPREFSHDFRRFISDGVSNTILVVVGGTETAVEWTKPGGLEFDAENPKQALGTLPDEGFPVVLADSRVLTLSKDIPDELFKALITHRGGEEIDQDELNRYVLAITGEPDQGSRFDDSVADTPPEGASVSEPDEATTAPVPAEPDSDDIRP